MEGEARDLVVEGELPDALDGTFFRNGSNPQFAPRGRYHWFDGDGMIHALSLRGGKAHYRNRFVRTAKFLTERAAGEALFGGLADMTTTDPRVGQTPFNPANTNIVVHAGRLLALCEAGLPHELDPHTLETLGPYDFGGKLVGPMTAHPKLDPETGEMLFFGYSPLPPFLRYHVVDAKGRLVRSEEIDVPVATMMHDFIVTRDHVVFMVCPATFRLERMAEGGAPIAWEPELGTKLGVMPRSGASKDVVWFEADPCYVFHPMNAYTEDGRIVADVARYAKLPLFGAEADIDEESGARLTRWTLDLAGGSVKEARLDDLPLEFPRFDERHAGLRYRHGYAAGIVGENGGSANFNAIVHVDLESGRRRMHGLPGGSFVGEPIFVPRSESAPEGEGFLLALVYRAEEHRSDLLVLDAENVEAAPVATVKLPHRIPFGFHGNWAGGL
jgi:carotenoid cleavage dioxygenase